MTGAPTSPRFLPAGEAALVVEYGQVIDPHLNDLVLGLDAAMAGMQIEGIIETVPTYRSLLIHFDPRVTTTESLIEILSRIDPAHTAEAGKGRRWRIPVCYDPSLAEDLAEAATGLGLSPEKLAALHAGATYRVYMYGFAPGFTFLGGLPEDLNISRRATPRPPAPPGSLLIAGGQALISTIAMPTGWYVIGQTPVRMFDPRRTPPFVVAVGDEIRFEPIDLDAFEGLRRQAEAGALLLNEEPV